MNLFRHSLEFGRFLANSEYATIGFIMLILALMGILFFSNWFIKLIPLRSLGERK